MAWLKPHHPRLVGSVLPRADMRSAMTGLGQGQPHFGCFRFRASLFHGSRILSSTPTSLLQVARLTKANPAGSLYSSSLRRSTSLCRPAGPGNRFTPSRSAARAGCPQKRAVSSSSQPQKGRGSPTKTHRARFPSKNGAWPRLAKQSSHVDLRSPKKTNRASPSEWGRGNM